MPMSLNIQLEVRFCHPLARSFSCTHKDRIHEAIQLYMGQFFSETAQLCTGMQFSGTGDRSAGQREEADSVGSFQQDIKGASFPCNLESSRFKSVHSIISYD